MILHRLSAIASRVLLSKGRRISRCPLKSYLKNFQIDCVFDVGANAGQYAQQLRQLGFKGRIESFEPLPTVLKSLHSEAASDRDWNIHEYALGAEDCRSTIHISANSPSSSFLALDDSLDTGNLNLAEVGSAEVQIHRLDSVFDSICGNACNLFLKIDTQGFERQVIEGATNCLSKFQMIQMECSLVPVYQDETLVEGMISLMRQHGFVPWWFLDGFRHSSTLQLYQTDVFFAKRA